MPSVEPLRPAGVLARYVLLGAGLGLIAGLAWVLLAPRVLVRAVSPPDFVDAYPQGFAAADLTLGVAIAVAGVVLGVVAARRLRRTAFEQGWVQVVGVIVGALVCAAVARVAGWWLAGRAVRPSGDALALPLTVGANGVLLLAVVTGLLVVTLGAALAGDDDGDEPLEPSTLPESG